MECLIGIGTGIIGKIGEYAVLPVGRQVGYLFCFNKNLNSLKSKAIKLNAVKGDVERRVDEEERNLREAVGEVKDWLTDVKQITEDANYILKEAENKAEMKCLHGFCPNLVLRHRLSRKSTKLVLDLDALEKKEFTSFAFDITPQDVPMKHYETFDSRTLVVNQIMNLLRKSLETNTIGVYGIGGVGKTTLAKEVSKQAADEKSLFDDVVMVLDVKSNPSIERIQKEIAEKLGLKFPDNESVAARARRLCSRVKDKKTLVILDDVWERIDLEAMGLVGLPTCKVLLTSRSREVLSGQMSAQEVFQLNVLTEEETWILFEKTAGDAVKDPSIRTVATLIAKRCGGLPVLVVTVASALKNSRSHAWKDALRRLKKFDKEEFTEKIYLALQWTCNQLNDADLKPLFLLCGLLAGYSNSVYILDLLKYSIGFGLLKKIDTMGEAWNALNSLLDKLKDSCLLLDSNAEGWVRMHDLVQDVATRISQGDQHVLKVGRGGELKQWPDKGEFCENCTMISLRTSNIPELPRVLEYKELKLLHVSPAVSDHYSLEIPDKFFEETKKLKVLDLTNLSIPSLPSSLKFLKDLQTLCLDDCKLVDIALVGKLEKLEILSFQDSKFKELPIEIGQLTHLRLLDLSNCSELEVISPGVISSLTRLEELRMSNSFKQWETEGVNITERKNASLSELKHLSRLSVLQIHVLDASILPADIFSSSLERYQIYVGTSWSWWNANENLNTLKLKLTIGHELEQAGVNVMLKRTEELHLDGAEAGNNTVYKFHGEDFEQLKHLHVCNTEFTHIINHKGVTRNMTKLVVTELNGSRFLLSSSVATSLVKLTHLEVSECPVMEEIISTNGSDEEIMENIFPKLEYLKLEDLPNLTSFWSRNYVEFQSLKALQSESGNEIEEIDSKEHIENVVEPFLFDKKLGFPSLKFLRLYRLNKLWRIWHKINSPENFKSLENLDIDSCEGLKSVFPSSLVTNLNLLTDLDVSGCRGLEVIVENEDGLQTTPKRFVFSKVESVKLYNLPQLGSFYPGMHISCWPSLKSLNVGPCNKVELFAQELSSFQSKHESTNHFPVIKGSLFLIDKDSFPKLDYLEVDGMEEFWDCSFPVKFLNKQENLQGVFHNLTQLVVRKIDRSKFLLSSSMARSLVQLTHFYISECSIMERIVSTKEYDEGNMDNMFPKLQCLGLSGLQNLTRFSSNENYNEIDEEGDSRENLENVVEHFLFDKKARFPNLKELYIVGLKKLRGIWHNQLSPECLKIFETIYIRDCESLINVFSSTMVGYLQQLREMTVRDCRVLEEIVSNEEGPPPTFVFSKVTTVKLKVLPQLRSFYPGKHISSWPSLKTLKVKGCDKVEILYQEFPSLLESTNQTPIKGTLFLINKDSFHNLEELYITGCHGLQHLITHSAAKRLMQLTEMCVRDCKGLLEIVGSNEGDDSGNEIAFSKLKELGLADLPRLRGFCAGNGIVKFPSLETLVMSRLKGVQGFCSGNYLVKFPSLKNLSMSNRLKLIIFLGDETLQISDVEENSDTDINSDSDGDSETVTEENDEIMDIGAEAKHEDETTQRRNKNEGTKVDETVIMGSRVEATAVDDFGALTLSTTSPDSSSSKLIAEDIPPTSNFQTQEDREVSTELILAKPLTSGSIHENVIPPNDSSGDQRQESARLEEEPPKRRVETNPSQTLAPNAAEACQSLDTINDQSTDHRNSNPSILVNEVDQDIDIVSKMEGNIEMALILKVQVQPTETNPRITDTVETVSDQGSVCDTLRDTTDGTRNFPLLQPLQAMRTDEEPQQVDVFRGLTLESDRSLDDKLSALAAITNKTKVILSAEDEEAKAVVLNVQAESSKIQYDVQAQERLKEALQHLKDKKLSNAKKLSSAMTSLDLIPQLSLNALALRRKISALQEEEQALQVEKANLNSNVAGIKSSCSALIQKRAALEELHQEIQNLQAKASTMAGEISFLEGHINGVLMDLIAFEENACKIDVNNTTMHEVETELVNIEASLDRHTNVVTRLLKTLF